MTWYDDEKFLGMYRIGSARLKGFDYGSNHAYFVTICTKFMRPYFGRIKNGIMGLSQLGCQVWRCWREIPNHFPFVVLDEFVVMPDHVHGIIYINKTNSNRNAINRVCNNFEGGGITKKYNPMGKKTLGEIIRYFKGRVSFEIRKNNKKYAWQPRFYDRIIRNEAALNSIRRYIRDNPRNWKKDKFQL